MQKDILLKALQICVAFTALTAAPAQADVISATGTISRFFLSGNSNFDFRVSINSNGVDALAGCSHSFAYMNVEFSNYQAKVATLISAQAQRQVVTATIWRDAGNWCRLDEFYVNTE